MKYLAPIAALLASAAGAETLPPGLVSAELRPGWVAADGTRMVALDLRLEPGWKTYWRSPGDAGIPPEFGWSDSGNVATATPRWPAPRPIRSGNAISLGYHDRLILPIALAAIDPARPVEPVVTVDFGLCLDICVPAHVSLTAGAPDPVPDPLILDAMAMAPRPDPVQPRCETTAIGDGIRLAATLPQAEYGTYRAAAMELPGVWVSPVEISDDGESLRIAADFIDETGKPFDLDRSGLLLTLLAPEGSVELTGCAH